MKEVGEKKTTPDVWNERTKQTLHPDARTTGAGGGGRRRGFVGDPDADVQVDAPAGRLRRSLNEHVTGRTFFN